MASQEMSKPVPVGDDVPGVQTQTPHDGHRQSDDDLERAKMSAIVVDSDLTSGTARAEAMQLVWGKHGRTVIWLGICMMLIA